MFSKKPLGIVFFFVTILCFSFSSHQQKTGPGLKLKKSYTYVISIGVDEPPIFFDNKQLAKLSGCSNDVEQIANYYYYKTDSAFNKGPLYIKNTSTLDSKTKHLSQDSSAIIFTLSNVNATFKRLQQIFDEIKRIARPEDVLIFHYAGLALNLKNETLGSTCILPLYDSVNVESKNADRGDYISFDQLSRTLNGFTLKSFLADIQCNKQLLIFDAGYGENFIPEFLKLVIDKEPAKLKLNTKQRCFIYNNGLGLETTNKNGLKGGILTSAFVSVPKEVMNNFLSERMKFETAVYSSFLSYAKQTKQIIRVSYEKDFEYFFTNVGNSQSRGSGEEEITTKTQQITIKNQALIIGTNQYNRNGWSQLSNPVNDAGTIEKELRENFSFKTQFLANPTRSEILKALLKYKRDFQYDTTSQLFIFIAGHGGYDNFVKGFIACKDSKSKEEDPLRDSYITHSFLRDIINDIDCKHIMVVLDVCFGGTFDGGGSRNEDDALYEDQDRNEFIADKLQYKSRLYLTSGGNEYVPDGRPGFHSPFAYRFIETLRSKGGKDKIITWSELTAGVETAKPGPKFGSFGDNQPGGNFLFISK